MSPNILGASPAACKPSANFHFVISVLVYLYTKHWFYFLNQLSKTSMKDLVQVTYREQGFSNQGWTKKQNKQDLSQAKKVFSTDSLKLTYRASRLHTFKRVARVFFCSGSQPS